MITEQVALLALSRAQVPQLALLRQLIDKAGSAKLLLENATDIQQILPGATPRLAALLSDASLIERAEQEMEVVEKNGINLICPAVLPSATTLRWCFIQWEMPISTPVT